MVRIEKERFALCKFIDYVDDADPDTVLETALVETYEIPREDFTPIRAQFPKEVQ